VLTANTADRHAGAGSHEGGEVLAVRGDEFTSLPGVLLRLVEVEDEVVILRQKGEAVCCPARRLADGGSFERLRGHPTYVSASWSLAVRLSLVRLPPQGEGAADPEAARLSSEVTRIVFTRILLWFYAGLMVRGSPSENDKQEEAETVRCWSS
jgi:hypothetical protein